MRRIAKSWTRRDLLIVCLTPLRLRKLAVPCRRFLAMSSPNYRSLSLRCTALRKHSLLPQRKRLPPIRVSPTHSRRERAIGLDAAVPNSSRDDRRLASRENPQLHPPRLLVRNL